VLYLRGGELNKINLTSADLTQTDLTRANLFNAKLNEANIENSIIQNTLFSDLDLSKTKGLDKFRPLGPSSIDHRTFMKSKYLPEKFLQDCGLPEQFIEHLPPLLNSIESVQYHSIFISYSSEDEKFANRFHADLQAQGIRY
jgi:hypothetical protein